MKFVIQYKIINGDEYYITQCGCKTWLQSAYEENDYETDDIKALISVHWSHVHSPRARQLAS